MSKENIEEGNDVENKLMTPEDKSYGTDKPISETQSQRKRNIFAKIRQLEASGSHIGIVQKFISYVFGTSELSKRFSKFLVINHF